MSRNAAYLGFNLIWYELTFFEVLRWYRSVSKEQSDESHFFYRALISVKVIPPKPWRRKRQMRKAVGSIRYLVGCLCFNKRVINTLQVPMKKLPETVFDYYEYFCTGDSSIIRIPIVCLSQQYCLQSVLDYPNIWFLMCNSDKEGTSLEE